jgi:hypothetical protein
VSGRVVVTQAFKAEICLKRGIAAMRRNSFVEAIQHFDEALELEPEDSYAHWNRGTSLLSLGDYIEGFREFEWRWQMWPWWSYGTVGKYLPRIREALPKWQGDDLTDRRLLFYNEMGYGDCIQQLRYVPVLQGFGAKVTALVEPMLVRLAQTLGCDVISEVNDTSAFDCRCSSFGVMAALAQSVEMVPGRRYLPLNWESSGGGKLGLAWSGRTQTEFSDTDFVSRLHGFELQSLQPSGRASSFVLPLPSGDFLDTAHIIEQVDHVVSVDTAVAHLAGAMGHPSVHVLIPYNCDWRWNFGHAWYPTVNFYRQKKPGDWAEQFSMLCANLRRQ